MARQSPSVLFVAPRFNPNSFWGFNAVCEIMGAKTLAPPLGLITVAAMLPQDWRFRLVDRNVTEMTDADLDGVDLVMTGGMLPQEPDALAVIAACRRKGVSVCVGGPAATSTPEAYEAADFVVAGEAETVIADFIADWEAGVRRGRYVAQKFQADVTKTPIPRFDLIDTRAYVWVNLQFSRGCPFTCEFCDIIELYGRAPRTKTTPQMLAELDRLLALGFRGHVDFVDDNLIGNKKAIKLFLPHLEEWQRRNGYPFKFSTEASLNLADDAELLQMMRRANFFALFTGIESPDEETLVQTQKKQNARRSITESVHRIYEAGMFVTAGFVIGFDTEKTGVARAMADCINDTSVATATISLLTALPNTQLARRLEREGRLDDDFRATMTKSGDMCTAGLNFVTLRPRRDILADYRAVVAEVYRPANYFRRVRVIGRKLNRPRFQERRFVWSEFLRYGVSFARLSWAMSVRMPELRYEYWRTLHHCLKRNPAALEAVTRNASHYLHLYPFSKYLVAAVDRRLMEMDEPKAAEAVRPAIGAVALQAVG